MKTPHLHSTNLLGSTLGRKFFSALLAAGLFFGRLETAHAQAFSYAPVTNAILGASLSINFAAMTANPTVGGTTVNELRLWDASGLTFLDLSQPLFGLAPWPSPPQINQGPLQTGFFSANISPAFFPVLLSGAVGMTAHLTDTADGVFALDTIQLNITTATGTILSYYGSPADGFGIGIAPGGNLPGTLPGSLPFTGTGFDEPVSGKFIDAIPEPRSFTLLVGGLLALVLWGRKNSSRAPRASKFKLVQKKILRMILISSLLGALGENVSSASPLTRAQAVATLLSPGSDLFIDTNLAVNVWCPYVDYGSGSGYEGLLPAFSTVAPFEPVSGPTLLLTSDAYFFWLDTLPEGDFEHTVYFVVMDANNPAPSVSNGGIQIVEENWWPMVTPSSGPLAGVTADYFHTSAQIESASPPGPFNPQGLIAGSTLQPGELSFTGAALGDGIIVTGSANAACVPATNACAIVLYGAVDKVTFRNSARLMEQDLVNHYGVRTNRIIRAGGTNSATLADLSNSITMLCNAQPPCDKIFIRMASHGGQGRPDLALEPRFYMRRSNLTDPTNIVGVSATELCNQFKKLAAKGVPICAVINCCYSGGLLTPNNWNFPAGSSVITATASNTVGLSWCYIDSNGIRFTNQLFTYAFSQCLNANPTNTMNGRRLDRNGDGCVDDAEAFAWVTNVRPCFVPCNIHPFYTNFMDYPAGGTNLDFKLRTNLITGKRYIETNRFVIVPQQRGVGTDPRTINLNVCNGTGTNKTDFHMIFQGNVTNGTASAWRSTVDDKFFVTNYWARGRTNTMITYDSNRNETMVCWTNGASPVQTNQYIHFGYFPPKGSTLRPLRQWWTPTTNQPPVTNPPAIRDRVPTPRSKILWDTNTALVSIQVLNDSTADGGWGTTLLVTNAMYYSRDLIPLQNLSLGNAAVTNLPLVLSNNGTVPPDGVMDFSATLPVSPGDPNPTAVLVTTASWSDNPMVTVTVQALPCNIFRGLTAATSADQIHLYGPSPNSFAAGTPQILTAMVENSFIGMEGVAVNYSVVMGSVQFTSGAIGGGGTTSSVQTDPSGAAAVDFTGTAAGPALIQASVNGMSAFQFLQVLSAPGVVTIKNATVAASRSMTLTIAGIPDQVYDIQCSTDLITWHTVATETVPASGVFEFTDTNAPPNCAFYRAVLH